MAEIVWYPGHMAKAKRLIKEALPNIDMVIELLDARAPISSTNPDFKSLFGNKPTLTLLTKCTLADPNETKGSKRRLGPQAERSLRSTANRVRALKIFKTVSARL